MSSDEPQNRTTQGFWSSCTYQIEVEMQNEELRRAQAGLVRPSMVLDSH